MSQTTWDRVDQASLESFPASDPPAWITAHAGSCSHGAQRAPRHVGALSAYYGLTHRLYGSWFASLYDRLTWPLRGLRARVAELADVRPGTRVLDVATGTGAQARAFADRGARVVGVDLSARMLDIGRRKHRGQPIELVEGDATLLPAADDEFDVSCIALGLHEMPASIRARTLQEMARVTRPGGKLVVVDHALPHNAIWRWLVFHGVKLFERDAYDDFVHDDLAARLAEAGVTVREDRPVLLGAGRIVIADLPV